MESNKKNIKDYQEVVKKNKPTPNKSHLYMSFIVGGIICMIGQFINNFFSRRGFSMLEAANMTSIVMVFLGSLLTGLGLYDNIGKKAGAGSIVPITGFANSIVSSAMEFQKEGYIFGMAANMFKIAGLIYFILTR